MNTFGGIIVNYIKKLSFLILCCGVLASGSVFSQDKAQQADSKPSGSGAVKAMPSGKSGDTQWMQDMKKQMASMRDMHMKMVAPGNSDDRRSLMMEQQAMMQKSMTMMSANQGNDMMGDMGKNQQMMEMRMQMMESMMQMMMDRMSVSPKQ